MLIPFVEHGFQYGVRFHELIPMNVAEFSNPYNVLGVSANSSHEEIKRTYQRLVLKVGKLIMCLAENFSSFSSKMFLLFQVHPDKLDESLTQEDRDKAYERFLAIDKAWKLLSNQETRANYDKQLKGEKKYSVGIILLFLLSSHGTVYTCISPGSQSILLYS